MRTFYIGQINNPQYLGCEFPSGRCYLESVILQPPIALSAGTIYEIITLLCNDEQGIQLHYFDQTRKVDTGYGSL